MESVILVNMPWSSVHRPALGISLLKSQLATRGIPCDLVYLNLAWAELLFERLGQVPATFKDLEDTVSQPELEFLVQKGGSASMVEEWIFAAALFGTALANGDEYAEVVLKREFDESTIRRIHGLRDLVPRFLDDCVGRIRWDKYTWIGFTSTFRQQVPSLCLAKRLKQLVPSAKIVFGGANCEGDMGKALLRNFDFVDYVISGEGDESFPLLLEHTAAMRPLDDLRGLVWRKDGEPHLRREPAMVKEMDLLPEPDYSDYFNQSAQVGFDRLFEKRLPVEQSRGCWWGQRSHCTFCGLNGTTMAYRAKSPERAEREIFSLGERWRVKYIDFSDNILHLKYFQNLIPALVRREHDFSFFYETKSNLKKAQLRLLREAGVRRIQPGIESLSTAVLKKMGKGCTALHNVQCLKWAHQFGIRVEWNILFGFPGEDADEYAAMLPRLESLTHFPPPNGPTRIRMDRFSPNFDDWRRRGFANVRPMRPYEYIYPLPTERLAELAYFFDYDYAEEQDPARYIAPIKDLVSRWQALVTPGRLIHVRSPDGGAIAEDTRFNRRQQWIEFDRDQNRVYTFCDEARSWAEIAGLGVAGAGNWLDDWIDKRIMVRDGDQFIGVAPVNEADPGHTRSSFDQAESWQVLSD